MTTDHTLIPVRETTAGGCCGGVATAAGAAQGSSCCATADAQATPTPADAHDDHHAAHDHGEHGHAGHDHGGHGHTHGHGGHPAAAHASAEDLAECPVMPGSPVVKSVAEAQGLFRDYNGERYWFCCAACGPLFDADPDKYAHAA
ncbi:YHS domain-containing protein [Naumannella sp. ID2617S]|nr:YHS domain-containing protein [Naumannella sp. ID2617S]